MKAETTHIVIRGCGAISPLGFDEASTSSAYLRGKTAFKVIEHAGHKTPIAPLSVEAEYKLQELIKSDARYRQLDRSVLMAVYATQQAALQAGWLSGRSSSDPGLAVNIGSSRGATGLFEQHFSSFSADHNAHVAPAVSPTTTLGNISSWAAQAVNAGGAQISHSITCSTALMALANGVAWLKAGMAKRFLVGGAEAPLTPFTISQMKAVGIYSKLVESNYPCQPYSAEKQNTFVLGEGAAVLALEEVKTSKLQKGDVLVEAIGLGFEPIKSKTGISEDGKNFQTAMKHALEQLSVSSSKVDLIITHTPGTAAGDKAELAAINSIFEKQHPLLTNNKWLFGHTLGASGALSLAYALHILKHQEFFIPQYASLVDTTRSTETIDRIMINAAGFGGNAASVILKKF